MLMQETAGYLMRRINPHFENNQTTDASLPGKDAGTDAVGHTTQDHPAGHHCAGVWAGAGEHGGDLAARHNCHNSNLFCA